MRHVRFAVLAPRSALRLGMAIIFAFLAATGAARSDETKTPRTDLYGDPLPPGTVARMGTTQMRHADVSSITFSKDGKTLISAGIDGTVRRWDVATGKQLGIAQLLHKVQNHESIVTVVLAHEGDVVAVCHKDGIFLHDTATGRQRTRLKIGRTLTKRIRGKDVFASN